MGSTAEADGRVIRHRTSVPRSTTTARLPAVTLVAGTASRTEMVDIADGDSALLDRLLGL